MRKIVRCTECLRQYDVRDRAVGERIHCACGDVMVVGKPRSHDAAVVRCSSCGSPCTDDDRSCAHCAATLTVHERDLHTVCPGCLARISDRASFCHGCGLRIVPETIHSAPTAWPCPVCGEDSHLRSRRFDEHVGGAECSQCGGLFIEHKVFAHLEQRARAEEPSAAEDHLPMPPPPLASGPPSSQHTGPLYRPCPACGKLMNRQNHARKSGVIVDRCRDHGIWFDDDELERVLRFVREGGAHRVAAVEAEEARQQESRKRLDRTAAEMRGPFESYERDYVDGFDLWSLVRTLFRSAR